MNYARTDLSLVKRDKVDAPGRLNIVVVIYIIAALVPAFFHVGSLMLSPVRIVSLVVLPFLLVQLIRGEYGRLVISDYCFLLFTLWTAIAFSVTSPESLLENVGSSTIDVLGGYLIARAFVRDAADFSRVIRTLATIILLLLPLTIYESLSGNFIILKAIDALPGVSSFSYHNQVPRLGLHRVQSVTAHAIHFGLLCAALLPLCFFALAPHVSAVHRYILTLSVLASAFLSVSAGPYLTVVVQLGLALWYWLFRGIRGNWILLCLTLLALYVIVDIISNRTPAEVFISYLTFSPHTGYWRLQILDWGLMNIFGNAERGIDPAPLFGIGLAEWVRPWYMFSGSMDNFWLVNGVRYGLPALLFLFIGYAGTILTLASRDFGDSDALIGARLGWVFSFVSLAVGLFTVHIWTNLLSLTFFLFGSGIWMLTRDASSKCREFGRESRYTRFAQTVRRPT